MCAKSKKSNVETVNPEFITSASTIAEQYRHEVYQDKHGTWIAEVIELPPNMGAGATPAEAIEDAIALCTSSLASMMMDGLPIPEPERSAKRTEQLHIRVTKQEKRMINRLAKAAGFRGAADFLRAKALM